MREGGQVSRAGSQGELAGQHTRVTVANHQQQSALLVPPTIKHIQQYASSQSQPPRHLETIVPRVCLQWQREGQVAPIGGQRGCPLVKVAVEGCHINICWQPGRGQLHMRRRRLQSCRRRARRRRRHYHCRSARAAPLGRLEGAARRWCRCGVGAGRPRCHARSEAQAQQVIHCVGHLYVLRRRI